MGVSKLDKIYRKLLLSKFFVKGWGNPDNLEKIFDLRKIIANKDLCYEMVDPHHPVQITKESTLKDCKIIEGRFTSPFEHIMPGLMPPECVMAQFQMLMPHEWKRQNYKPVCIQLAGTGDHFYARRRILMARPLLREYGIASIILENPFYGSRKPAQQKRSSLCNVSDLFVMGACLILECNVLMHWCARQKLGPVGISGISMGGHMASLAACSWPKPVPLIPCLSWTTASAVFTQGVMSEAIDWELLKYQYLQDKAYRDTLFNKINSPEGYFSVYHEAEERFIGNSNKIVDKTISSDISHSHKSISQDEFNNKLAPSPSGLVQKSQVTEPSFSPQFSYIDQKRNGVSSLLQEEKANMTNISGEKWPHASSSGDNYSREEFGKINISKSLSSSSMSSDGTHSTSTKADTSNLLMFFRHGLPISIRPYTIFEKLTKTINPQKVINDQKSKDDFLNIKTDNNRKVINDQSGTSNKFPTVINAPSDPHMGFTPAGVRPKDSPHSKPVLFNPYTRIEDPVMWEVFQFMRGIMDECTHLGNFGYPTDTELIIIIQATKDAYMPVDSITPLDKLWPGCQIRELETGHINAFLTCQQMFRKAINDSFLRTYEKYGQMLSN